MNESYMVESVRTAIDGLFCSEAANINQIRLTLFVEGKLMNEIGDQLAHCTETFKVAKGKSPS